MRMLTIFLLCADYTEGSWAVAALDVGNQGAMRRTATADVGFGNYCCLWSECVVRVACGLHARWRGRFE